MRFFISEKEISFNDFQGMAPDIAPFLEAALELNADFEISPEGRLSLRSEYSAPIYLDPNSDLEYHRRFFYKNSVYTQPLAKALGLKKGKAKPHVLDATAGTLKDSCLIIGMGMEVLACERHPVAQALILSALKSAPVEGLEFFPGEATSLAKERMDFDVIYFDPMYEQKNEKAAPRKEMRIFRDVVKPDLDAAKVATLLRSLGKRLVIKRSNKASPLIGQPDVSFGKKSTAYDVYLP